MRKHLLRVFGILLLIFTVAAGTLLYQGYFRYQREIEALPVKDAVESYTLKKDYVPYEELDEDFINAVIAVEDKRFFTRKGYDFIALGRALYHDLQAGEIVEGGSTITEQISKNLYLGGYINGMEEKIAGIFLLFDLEKHYSKEELLALYVNMNYYGDSYHGISEAAKGYYDASASDLSLARAAILAGLPNAPSVYQLSDGYDKAKERQEWVLQTMCNNGYITESEVAEALQEDVRPR
ncbi:MAG: transglycosylase domain-containing protein [Erysipelotrichaceae bacterium]|nr:transglycosylase domain-containing protein [Erysipelotrichaceae bacterium]